VNVSAEPTDTRSYPATAVGAGSVALRACSACWVVPVAGRRALVSWRSATAASPAASRACVGLAVAGGPAVLGWPAEHPVTVVAVARARAARVRLGMADGSCRRGEDATGRVGGPGRGRSQT